MDLVQCKQQTARILVWLILQNAQINELSTSVSSIVWYSLQMLAGQWRICCLLLFTVCTSRFAFVRVSCHCCSIVLLVCCSLAVAGVSVSSTQLRVVLRGFFSYFFSVCLLHAIERNKTCFVQTPMAVSCPPPFEISISRRSRASLSSLHGCAHCNQDDDDGCAQKPCRQQCLFAFYFIDRVYNL